MKATNSLTNRLLAFALTIVMVTGMLPTSAFAVSDSVITSTLGDEQYTVGQTANFTVTTTGNDDANTMVLGSFEIKKNGNAVNIADVATLEYQEYPSGTWYEFTGDFGPAATGFPLQAAATTSNFRVTFKTHGTYTVKVFVKTFEGAEELCAIEKTVTVAKANPATITTTLGTEANVVGQTANFTVTTTGNDDANTMVLGSFEIKKNGNAVNIADVATLEYQEYPSGTWYEFTGDFGPAATGFPLQAGATTSNFRVTFKVGGEYTVKVFVKTFANSEKLCFVEKTVKVKTDQVDFSFAEKDVSVTYNDNADNKYTYTVQNPKGTVTYTIVSGSEYATINAGTGELTVIKPGVVTVKASDTGNDLYNPAEATYTLTINKDNQEITFATPVPEDQWIGAPFVNTVSGGNGTGEISYWLVDGENLVEEISGVAKISKTTGELTFLCVGTQITVKAVKDADDYYNEASATYTVTATKKEPTEVAFATTGPITITYNPENLSFKNNVVGCGEDDVITWSIVSGDAVTLDTATGALTINKAGTIVIKATVAESPYYFEKAIEYTLVINPANQADLYTGSISTQITYSPDVQAGLIVGAGGSGTGAYGYEIVEGNEFAEINAQTGAIKILKAGNLVGDEFVNGVIKVKITKAGDDCYNAAESVYVTISLARADQSAFGYGDTDAATVTYNDNNNKYTVNATGGQSSKDVVYTIISGDAATVKDSTGVVTITKAGTVTIKATKPADDCYNAIEDTFTLTINKDEQDYSFTETGTIPLTYGKLSYTNELIKGTYVSITKDPVYTISQNTIGASVNATTGEVTFADSEGKVGKVTITVTVAEDDCYEPFTASYELDVSYLETTAVPTTAGETKNDSGWYTDKVVIKAPTGYTIAYDNELSTVWKDAISFTEEGINDVKVFLKNAAGFITDEITVSNIKLDTVNPNNLTITYTQPTWEVVLEAVTFGIYQSENLQVSISAEDTNSGIAKLVYNIGDGDVEIPVNGTASASHSFTINAQHRNEIVLTATDVSGRTTIKEDDIVVVLDTDNPDITAKYTYASGTSREENGIYYTQKDTTITFTIDESNFDLSGLEIKDSNGAKTAVPVVKVNSEEETVSWTRVEGTTTWETSITLSGNGDYTVTVDFTDPANNVMDTYTKEIHIDDTTPVISVTYDNNEAINGNYFKANRTATVQIKAHNFKAEEVKATITAKDITGADVDISSKAYADYVKDPDNWTNTNDVWTLKTDGMLFDIDAVYSVKIEYTDLNGNAAQAYTTEFVLDKTDADNITISYSTSVIDKILEAVTFGFYKGDVIVTVTAKDVTAGVEYFEITYTQDNGANTTNKASYKTEKLQAVQDNNDKTLFVATHTITAQARGTVSVNVMDMSGNDSAKADNKVVVLDTIQPGLDVVYTFTGDQSREYNNIYYTQGDTTIEFTIDEANFDLTKIIAEGATANTEPVVTVNNIPQNVTWTQTAGTNKWVGSITLSGYGDYIVAMTYSDWSSNEMAAFSKEIHIDNVDPTFDVTYDNNEARNTNKYKDERTATIKVTEHNFLPNEVEMTVTAKDITGADVDISSKAYAEYAKNPANWSKAGDVWTLKTDGTLFDIDAIYTVTLNYTDLAENAAQTYTTSFVIDQTDANNIKIEYSTSVLDKILEEITFGFYQPNVTATLTAEDMTAGVEYFVMTYTVQDNVSVTNTATFSTEQLAAIQDSTNKNVFTARFTIPAQARGTVSVDVKDQAGNDSDSSNATVLVVDTVNPTREVLYTPYKILDKATMLEVAKYNEGDNSILYYKDKAVVTFKITETNFDLSLKDEATKPLIKVNGTPVTVEWTQSGDVWTATYTIMGDGDYKVTMTYADLSTNEMIDYESCEIKIDGTAPEIDVKYANGTPNQTIEGTKYYGTTQTVAVQITDHNFRADDVILTVTAKDIQGNAVDIFAKAYADYAKNRANWTSDGDVHTLKTEGMVFDIDAIYTFDIVYDDICDNYAQDYPQDDFVVDHVDPTELKISYSTPVIEKIIETLTFGFYQPSVTVTFTVDDITSGIDFIEWTYTKQVDTSDVNAADNGGKITTDQIAYSNKGKTATATITIPANARGYVTATVTDRAGKDTAKADNSIINVVDNIAPSISVTYEADSTDTKVQFVDGNKAMVDSFDKATNAFYNGNVTAKIVINEANFFEGITAADGVIHQVGIKLTKTDDDGNKTVIEYLPTGATQLYAGATPKYFTWTTTGDEHTLVIPYEDNADYILEISYTDFSTNDAGITANDGLNTTKSYVSKIVTVDKVAPVIDVTYGNTEVINTIEGRKYFNKVQTAVITVTEHNFRAADIAAVITAKDVVGANVSVADFAAQLADKSNWKQNGNVYAAEVQYTVDANYTFDIDYKDLALNTSADYTQDLFTVDVTAPENLTVDYSTSVFEQIKESITFGYYNAMMTVTITAEDDTSGIYHFAYSYIKGKDVSGVNAELLDQAIKEAEITYDGKKATATFNIPKMVLGADNQFNGTVEFTAFDRSEVSTELKDSTVIVVDNITPTSKITYNAPVQTANGISYYDGDINATIVVTEANFDAKDVVVTVTKDGENFPVNVSWRDDSVDTHTGTFTLTKDGDYIVSVQYKDKSGNQMTSYKSNELTLDATKPTIKVSNIKANSANKDEKYGFVITVNDTNLDASSLKPVLKAVVQKEEGVYMTKEIDLGDAKTVVNGETYTYTVEDLPDDGFYTLTCEAKDMSANGMSQIVLDDGESYDQVQFSINRNGSAFGYGDKFTEELVGQYYIYSVDEDVVIVEVNVDPIEEYKVTLNGKELVEGTDYTTIQTSKDGEWSKRTYTIKKALFESEGEYSIIVSSTDKADTTAFSDVKNLSLAFVVDQTKPVLTITGLEVGGRYQTDAQTVTLIPTDEGGRLNSLTVLVMDSNGNPLKDDAGADISVRFDMAGEELLKHLEDNDGKVTFTIPEGLNNQVKIICNDCAVNAEDLPNEYNELFERVTVSQNQFVIFYANTPLFVGTIVGVLAVAGLIVFLVKRKGGKKNKTAAKA